ncbi:hypothetical protein MIDIC_10023 [Alphaproteobacteria bacterium]
MAKENQTIRERIEMYCPLYSHILLREIKLLKIEKTIIYLSVPGYIAIAEKRGFLANEIETMEWVYLSTFKECREIKYEII